MKIRSLLTVVAMLSVLLFGIGTAYAVFGVADDVPGQDLVWPMICQKAPNPPGDARPAANLNTNWAISNLSSNFVELNCTLWTRQSVFVNDFTYEFTPNQVVPDDCQSLSTRLGGQAQLTMLNADIITKTGTGAPNPSQGDYYAGYVTCAGPANIFMNNIYLIDPPLGFATGFNGPTEENGAGAQPSPTSSIMGESSGAFQFTAFDMYLRYYLNNDPQTGECYGPGTGCPNTWDWWIILASRNQYTNALKSSTRQLAGSLFDENEHSQSINIPIPNELNIVSVASFLPGAPFFEPLECPLIPPTPYCTVTFPKAGYVAVHPHEFGSVISGGNVEPFTIDGTCNVPSGGSPCTGPGGFYSIFGWSYQRAEAAQIVGDYDVIHPMLRTYCTGGVQGTSGSGNVVNCTCAGSGCS